MSEVRVVTHKSGAPKGIAYIQYEDEVSILHIRVCLVRVLDSPSQVIKSLWLVFQHSAAQAVMKMDGLAVGEHNISVAISNPPARKAPASERFSASTFTPSLGGGKKDITG